MREKERTALACFGAVVILLVTLIGIPVIDGFVLSIMWGWFIAPLFGLPGLSIPFAIGIALVVGVLTHQKQPKDAKETEWYVDLFVLVVGPFIVLLFAWVVHFFI